MLKDADMNQLRNDAAETNELKEIPITPERAREKAIQELTSSCEEVLDRWPNSDLATAIKNGADGEHALSLQPAIGGMVVEGKYSFAANTLDPGEIAGLIKALTGQSIQDFCQAQRAEGADLRVGVRISVGEGMDCHIAFDNQYQPGARLNDSKYVPSYSTFSMGTDMAAQMLDKIFASWKQKQQVAAETT